MRNVIYDFTYRGYRLRKCKNTEKNEGFYREVLDRINDLLCCCREQYSKPFFVWFVLKFPKESRFAKRDDNMVLCHFVESFRKFYQKEYPSRAYHRDGREKIPLPLCLWAREVSESGQYHYHVTVVLNGQKDRKPKKAFYRARNLWATCLNRAAKAEEVAKARAAGKVVKANEEYPDAERFSPDEVPVDFGYNDYKEYGSREDNPFRYGGYKIDHWEKHKTVVDDYHAMYEFLSYYAKVYSKVRNEDLSRKTKSFGCSQIPRYRDEIDEMDLMMRRNR